ncbi:uncharacterized protein LOC129230388 [Uloborus diversus]|uniref:uncharacterized protein LOC129230388 n=1 Tax=Uloborus diversus TaxID=327109 RepID=UPI002409B3E0|nr:uncharacterized protein LOC129230388 [Uloborus diversus]
MRLCEAGFETNPLAEASDGISAFIHAVKTTNVKMCRTLYDSAVNSHWLSGNCVRNPDNCIVESLQLFKAQIQKDCKTTENFGGSNQLIKRSKLDRSDSEYVSKCLDTCCYPWEALEIKLQIFFKKNELKQMVCRILLLKVCSPDCVLNQTLKDKIFKVMNQKMNFLFERIRFIKQILIDQDEEISHYFQWGRSLGLKHHTKFLMAQRFRKDMAFRASLEMLLLDCSNVFERKDLKDLWKKAEYFLSGINIGDVLAHGNAILDTIGGMLDPKDLPTELVGKMLELVNDKEHINKMVELSEVWYESKDAFRDALREKDLCRDCTRVESYLELMPYH